MLQKLHVNDFKWVGNKSQFNEYFIKSYNKEKFHRCFLETDVQYPENLDNLFCQKEWKLKKSKKTPSQFPW